MGQLANTTGLHLMQNKHSNSFWYSDYYLYRFICREDFLIYLYLRSCSSIKYNMLKRQHLYKIEILQFCIYRAKNLIILNLHLICSKKKFNKELNSFALNLLSNLRNILLTTKNFFFLSYKKKRKNAKFVAVLIGLLIEKRIRFRSNVIRSLLNNLSFFGVRVKCKGRLNLVDRARKDQIVVGSVPLQTLKAYIDYGFVVVNTKKGLQSLKVWICIKK
jgi:ribosomal protein S3